MYLCVRRGRQRVHIRNGRLATARMVGLNLLLCYLLLSSAVGQRELALGRTLAVYLSPCADVSQPDLRELKSIPSQRGAWGIMVNCNVDSSDENTLRSTSKSTRSHPTRREQQRRRGRGGAKARRRQTCGGAKGVSLHCHFFLRGSHFSDAWYSASSSQPFISMRYLCISETW